MATKFRALIVTVQLRLKEIIYTVAIFRLQRYTPVSYTHLTLPTNSRV